MRIAFISPTLNVGGYEKVVIAYANELNRRGHDVDILCGQKTGDLINTISDGVSILDFHARARSFLKPLTCYLLSNRPSILYCAFREYNCIGVIAKRLARVDTCVYASQHGFQEETILMSRIKGRIIQKADRLITAADGIAEYESKCLGIDRRKFITCNNPVLDRTKMINDEYHPWFVEKKRIPIIVMSGRITCDKGIDCGIDILAELNKSKTIRMICLGNGPALPEIKEYAKRKNVAHLVEFLGFVENPLGYMRQCSLLLHTASAEGFGNVIVEALCCNIPVCTTNCSGPMQIIENGKYGVNLGSVHDAEFVRNAAIKILDVLEGRIAFKGLETRAACYDVAAATNQFLSIL